MPRMTPKPQMHYHDAYVEVIAVTDQALLCDFDGEEYWIPKNVINDTGDIRDDSDEGEYGLIVIQEWFAIKEGIV